MGKIMNIPQTSELMKIVNSVVDKECKCVGLKKPASFKIKIAALSGGAYDKEQLLVEVAKIIKSAQEISPEEACWYFVLIVEIIRKVMSPKDENKKSSKKIREAEEFISSMDSILKFI